MARKRLKPEEIVSRLRQVDVLQSQGKSAAEAIRSIGMTELTYYRWRKEFGGLKADQVKRWHRSHDTLSDKRRDRNLHVSEHSPDLHWVDLKISRK